MSTIADLNPDVALAALLDGKVTVQTSATQSHTIRAYGDEERPNKGVGDEFIDIGLINTQSLTQPIGYFDGNLTLTICIKTQSDGRAKKKLERQIVAQCQELINGKSNGGFHFEFDPSNVITPTTTTLLPGYSTKVINVKWHVTDEFLQKQ